MDMVQSICDVLDANEKDVKKWRTHYKESFQRWNAYGELTFDQLCGFGDKYTSGMHNICIGVRVGLMMVLELLDQEKYMEYKNKLGLEA